MTSQTKCIEVLTQTYNKKTCVYSVSYFDSNTEDSEIEETTISQDSLIEFIDSNGLNIEEYVNDYDVDHVIINEYTYLNENTDAVITEYLNANS